MVVLFLTKLVLFQHARNRIEPTGRCGFRPRFAMEFGMTVYHKKYVFPIVGVWNLRRSSGTSRLRIGRDARTLLSNSTPD